MLYNIRVDYFYIFLYGDEFQMLENILTVGNQVLILFILIAVGFVCRKRNIFSDSAVAGLTNFVLYIVTPCVIINSYLREYNPEMLSGLLITVIAAFISFAVNILIAHFTLHDKDEKSEKVIRFASVFSNCGYMSIPLQNAVLGSDGVFFGATYIAVFNIVLWTYGVLLMSGDKNNISVKKFLINPGIIGTALGLIVFFSPVKLPYVIAEPVSYLAALNTPVPMMIIGYYLAGSSFRIKGASVYLSMFLKLIVFPLLMLLGLYLAGIRGVVLASSVTSVAAPVAAATTMFSEKFGGNTPLSASMVSVSTLLSIITMPVIIGISMAI